MNDDLDALMDWIDRETHAPVSAPALAVLDEIRNRHGRAVAAVLFYGSCLREKHDRAAEDEGVLDLYVLVDRYRHVYAGWLMAAANALMPPNVLYIEVPWEGRRLRAKYAIITLAQFRRGTSRRSFRASLWARFAQPVRLIYARDADSRKAVVAALCDAVTTMVGRVAPLLGEEFSASELWRRGFQETYRAELRAEGPDRARELYESGAERYDRITPMALRAGGVTPLEPSPERRFRVTTSAAQRHRSRLLWTVRRWIGKPYTALSLIKGAFTFDGAVDYILWKVERHSGVRTTVTSWQRRHPVLASPILVWRLYRQGALH